MPRLRHHWGNGQIGEPSGVSARILALALLGVRMSCFERRFGSQTGVIAFTNYYSIAIPPNLQ